MTSLNSQSDDSDQIACLGLDQVSGSALEPEYCIHLLTTTVKRKHLLFNSQEANGARCEITRESKTRSVTDSIYMVLNYRHFLTSLHLRDSSNLSYYCTKISLAPLNPVPPTPQAISLGNPENLHLIPHSTH
jgi:hypothetical protein